MTEPNKPVDPNEVSKAVTEQLKQLEAQKQADEDASIWDNIKFVSKGISKIRAAFGVVSAKVSPLARGIKNAGLSLRDAGRWMGSQKNAETGEFEFSGSKLKKRLAVILGIPTALTGVVTTGYTYGTLKHERFHIQNKYVDSADDAYVIDVCRTEPCNNTNARPMIIDTDLAYNIWRPRRLFSAVPDGGGVCDISYYGWYLPGFEMNVVSATCWKDGEDVPPPEGKFAENKEPGVVSRAFEKAYTGVMHRIQGQGNAPAPALEP